MKFTEINQNRMTCSECGGPAFSTLILAEKHDACYNKVRSRYKVWPSAYASGALVQCRKKGAANWGNKTKNEGVAEGEMSPMAKDAQKQDKIRSLKNLISIAREQGRQLRVQELELELKKLQGVAEGEVIKFPGGTNIGQQSAVTRKQGNVTPITKRTANPDIKLAKDAQGRTVAQGKTMHSVYEQDMTEANNAAQQAAIAIAMKKAGKKPVDEDYNPEYDDEAGMADNNLETMRRAVDGIDDLIDSGDNLPEWCQEKIAVAKSMLVSVWDYMRSEQDRGATAELTEEFDLIESIVDRIAAHNGVDAEVVWEDLESLTEDELYAFAVTSQLNEDWSKVNKQDRTAGMSRRAVKAYRRENPGSKLQTAVTIKPSKLKKGSKASKRRKSYCSRSRGQMKMHNISCAKTPDKAICKARRRWNC